MVYSHIEQKVEIDYILFYDPFAFIKVPGNNFRRV